MTTRTALLLASLAACDSPSSTGVDASDPGQDSAAFDAPTAPDAPLIDAPPIGTCPAGQLCLRVNPVPGATTIPNGRLVVVFYQLNDNITPYPALFNAYDAPFIGTSTSVQIPLASITAPSPIDDYRLCPRTCGVLTNPACDCPAAAAKITTGFVFVMTDTNSNGAIDPAELTDTNQYGVGWLQLGGSDQAYPNPHALQTLLPEGILDGLIPYRVIDLSPFDKMGLPAPGMVFDLDVCVPGSAGCDMVRFPNLT